MRKFSRQNFFLDVCVLGPLLRYMGILGDPFLKTAQISPFSPSDVNLKSGKKHEAGVNTQSGHIYLFLRVPSLIILVPYLRGP